MATDLGQHHPGTFTNDIEQIAKMLQGSLQSKTPSTGIGASVQSDPPASASITSTQCAPGLC